MAENKGFHRIWDFIINIPPIRWFLNLPVCRKIGESKIGSKLFCYETVSYLFFGVMTTVVSVLSYWLFSLIAGDGIQVTLFGETRSLGYLIANTLSFICAMLFAYVTNKLFVFESRGLSFGALVKEILLFAAARLSSFGIEMLWMFVTVTLLSMNDMISKLIAQVIVVIMNYILSKIMVFRKPKNKGELK